MVPTSTRIMLRMNASAVISRVRTRSDSSIHSAASTIRSNRTCSVWVGVNAVKSCSPLIDAAHSLTAVTPSGYGHQSARPSSNGSRAGARRTR